MMIKLHCFLFTPKIELNWARFQEKASLFPPPIVPLQFDCARDRKKPWKWGRWTKVRKYSAQLLPKMAHFFRWSIPVLGSKKGPKNHWSIPVFDLKKWPKARCSWVLEKSGRKNQVQNWLKNWSKNWPFFRWSIDFSRPSELKKIKTDNYYAHLLLFTSLHTKGPLIFRIYVDCGCGQLRCTIFSIDGAQGLFQHIPCPQGILDQYSSRPVCPKRAIWGSVQFPSPPEKSTRPQFFFCRHFAWWFWCVSARFRTSEQNQKT